MRDYIITGDLSIEYFLENPRFLKNEYDEENAKPIAKVSFANISFIKCKLDSKMYVLKEYKIDSNRKDLVESVYRETYALR